MPQIPAVASSRAAVRTVLAHRKHRGPTPWWHDAVICSIAGGLSHTQLKGLEAMASDLAGLGFQAVSILPATSDLVWNSTACLGSFIQAMHAVGLKVIVTLPGARLPAAADEVDIDEGVSTLLGRVRACLRAEADGIDLGLLAPPVPRHPAVSTDPFAASQARRFSTLVQVLLAEMGEDDSTILTAESPVADPQLLQAQLHDDWFHHLRDGALEMVPWNSTRIQRAVIESFEARDPMGQIVAWTWSGMHHLKDLHSLAGDDRPATVHGAALDAWEQNATPRQRDAMGLFVLSLPGAAHLTWTDVGGRAVPEADDLQLRWASDQTLALRHQMITRVLELRTARKMGSGSLATVSGLDWVHPGVGVHIVAGVMVVLNTSTAPVHVPSTHTLLASSLGEQATPGQPFAVEPDSCAWFETARVQPSPSPFEY